jgi:hypothetical protein
VISEFHTWCSLIILNILLLQIDNVAAEYQLVLENERRESKEETEKLQWKRRQALCELKKEKMKTTDAKKDLNEKCEEMEFEKVRMKECREVLLKKVLGERDYKLKNNNSSGKSSSWLGGNFSLGFSLGCSGNNQQSNVDVWNELPPMDLSQPLSGGGSGVSGEIALADRHSGYVIITNRAGNNNRARNNDRAGHINGRRRVRNNNRAGNISDDSSHSESSSDSLHDIQVHQESNNAPRNNAPRNNALINPHRNQNAPNDNNAHNINAQLNASHHNRVNLLQHQNQFLASKTNIDLPKDSYYCSICMVNLKNTIMYPCGHAVACEGCAKQLVAKKRGGELKCPVCRKGVKCPVKFFGVFECDDVLRNGVGSGGGGGARN